MTGARRKVGWLVPVALLCWGAPAAADVYDEAFERGNAAYFRGDYAAAAAAYEQIDQQGVVSPDLTYNLGVTYFRKHELGRSAWYFERTLGIDEDHEDARFNLALLKMQIARASRDKLEGSDHPPLWIRVVLALDLSTETWLFSGFYLLGFLLLFLRLRARGDNRAPYTAGAALAVCAALLCGGLLAGRAALDRIPFGIVLPDSLAVKEGADSNHRTSFALHAGMRVRLLETDQDWVRLRLPNGLEGWARAADIGRL